MSKVTPFLWFDNNLGEAMAFYKSIFKDYKDLGTQMMPDGKVMTGAFSLNGQEFNAMNAGPEFKFNEAVSFLIECKDQEEVDFYWDRLIAGGGEEQPCGWLKDKFGLSWQVIPVQLNELLSSPDREKADRAMQAMLKMKKIIIADLEKAFNGE